MRGPRPLRCYRTRLITGGLGVEMVQIPGSTAHNDAADDEDAHYCTSQERGAQMAQILGSKEAWKGAYSRT